MPPQGCRRCPRSSLRTATCGCEMLIWGGLNTNYLNDGARYDPVGNAWTPLPDAGLAPRQYHTAVWASDRMIIWGGYDNGYYLNDGGSYRPAANAWTAVSTTG